jgi:signal transduction histidine kinase
MVPRALLGLRARTIAAIMLACAMTLGVAAVALLSPLEHRLRTAELERLADAALLAKPQLSEMSRAEARRGSPELRAVTRSLRRRADAQAVILDARGHVLAGTDVDAAVPFDDAAAALHSRRTVRSIRSGPEGERARVALAVRTDGGTVAVVLRKSLRDVSATVGIVRRAFTLAAVIALASALLLGIALSGRIVRRLRALRDTALRVAEIGPVAEVRADNARDEVGDLTRAFATMQVRLREQEQARRTFVATASHELRTPLTSLQLVAELLREDLDAEEPDVEAARARAERSEVQVRRLSRLAEELLDLSRIDAGVPLRREPVELSAISRAVIGEFEPCGARIELAANGAIWAQADPGGVAQILRILVDNARRYAPPGRPIRVSCTRNGWECGIAVVDEGPGIPVSDRERIFRRFERGDETQDHGGFGLGLAIGRELARQMGGDLILQVTPGGASFALELPLDDESERDGDGAADGPPGGS